MFCSYMRSSAPSFPLIKEPSHVTHATRTQAPAHAHHYSGRIHSRPDTRLFGSLGRDERQGPVGSETVSGAVVTQSLAPDLDGCLRILIDYQSLS